MARKPKILRIINRFNLGGPTFNAAYLTKYLSDDFETLLIGGVKDESEDSSEFILEKLDLKPNYIKNMYREVSFKNDRAAYTEIKQIIAEFKPDIVHTHASKAGFLGRLAASKMKVPVIVHTFHGHVLHSYFGALKTNVYKNIERYLAKKTTRIIAISPIQKEELSSHHKIAKPGKFTVVKLGFDLEKFHTDQASKRIAFRKKYDIEDDVICVAIIGRLVPIKNHSLFLEAFKSATQHTNKKVLALIVGDGECKSDLIALCRTIQLDEKKKGQDGQVLFTSWIKNVDEVLAGSDIVALSSLNEGTPVTLIEAQAASKPIVSTNVGGIEDIVIKDQTALLSPSKDVDALSKNLVKLIDNYELRLSMAAVGKTFALKNFNYSRLTAEIRDLYFQLLDEKEVKI